jgi:cell division septal protein FtsQ
VRRLILALVLVGGLFVAGGAALLVSPLYRLRRLEVTGPGAARVTEAALGLTRRTSLLAIVPALMAARALAADPLARTAHAWLAYPHTLHVALTPRQPQCLILDAAAPDGVWGADGSGMILPVTAGERHRLPFCTGAPAPTRDLERDPSARLAADLAALRALPASVRTQVSEVNDGARGLTLVLLDGRPVRIGTAADLRAKEALLPDLLRRYPWPEYAGVGFDVRNPARPALYGVP